MSHELTRRQFVEMGAVAGLSLAASTRVFAAGKKSVLVFTKSSGFEHDVVKLKDGKPSIMDNAITALGQQHRFDVTATKDGGTFDSPDFHKYAAVIFFTTGDLTTPGTDKNPPMPPTGKQALLDFVASGKGFIGTHSASDTFHTDNESKKGPERYLNHGKDADAMFEAVTPERACERVEASVAGRARDL